MRAALAAMAIVAVAPAGAAAQGATDTAALRAFLDRLYAPYGRDLTTQSALDRPRQWFEPRLAAAILADQASSRRRNEVGRIDADPFCQCQDGNPFRITVSGLTVAGNRARARVRFTNFEPVTLDYQFVKTPAGWRIHDITGPGYRGLRWQLGIR